MNKKLISGDRNAAHQPEGLYSRLYGLWSKSIY
jgi:hypothetical protein